MARTAKHPVPPDIALPRDFSARYGGEVSRGVSLGGGGLFFVAWQGAYLHQLAADGIRVQAADRVVGTSAGSIVATALTAGRVDRLERELRFLSKAPWAVQALAPSSGLRPSQDRALQLFVDAADSDPATIRAIGHAGLGAATAPAGGLGRNIRLLVGVRAWPSPALHISCVDAYTGERCIVTGRAGVAPSRAAAASSAVPGLFAPQTIGDRKCMDGGVSGTGIHLDVLGGARRALVLSLSRRSGSAGPLWAGIEKLAVRWKTVRLAACAGIKGMDWIPATRRRRRPSAHRSPPCRR